MDVALEEQLAILSETVKASDLFIKLRIDYQMEVIVNLLQLSDVFILHLSTSSALSARMVCLREAHLIDNDVMNVDLKLCKFNSKSFCFIK